MFPKNAPSGASLAAVAFLCCVAAAARAGEKTELRADVLVEQDYDSNIFASDTNVQGSPITIVRPELHFENIGTLGHARLDGWLSSHTYWNETALNGADRGIGGDLSRTIFPRMSVFANGSYQRLAAHSEIRDANVVTLSETPGVPSEPVISPGQLVEGSVPNVDLAQGQFGASYQLTPRSSFSLSGGPFSINYLASDVGRADLRDRAGWFTTSSLQHALSALDTISFELGANSTSLDDAILGTTTVQNPFDPHAVDLNTGKTTSDQQSLTVGWDRSWSESWRTRFAIGGRRLHTKTLDTMEPITRVAPGVGGAQAFTDFVPTNFDDVGPGWIGELTVERALPRGSVTLSYSRETRTTSSLAASNVNVDVASFSFVHRLSARATFTLLGTFEHYVSANNSTQFAPATYQPGSFNPITGPEFSCQSGTLIVTGSGANKGGQCSLGASSTLSNDTWRASARVDWQLRKRLSTFVVLRYLERSGDVQLFGNPYNKYNVGVGLRYDYDFGL